MFIDFWNFQLAINRVEAEFKIDWRILGRAVAEEVAKLVDPAALLSYQGTNVYGSYDPKSPKDQGLNRWATNTLNRFPGVQVFMLERQRRQNAPTCPSCLSEVPTCPFCQSDIRGTEEKGVDTRIATDMIKLAWVNDYDVAVLLSSDQDFVPVVEFLSTRGIKTIHGAFPPFGASLSLSCWGNLRIPDIMPKLRRA